MLEKHKFMHPLLFIVPIHRMILDLLLSPTFQNIEHALLRYIYIYIYIYTFIDDRNSPRIVERRGYNDLYSKIIPSRFVALPLKCYPSIILRKYYREQLLIQSTRRSCAHPGMEFE